MWAELWDDFDRRSSRLSSSDRVDPADAIDQTISWQLAGDPAFVGRPIAVAELMLPELFSGAPWRHGDRAGMNRWLMFITANPSIDPDEAFPSRRELHAAGAERLVRYFEERFEPGPIAYPLVHGRDGNRLAVWTRHGQRRRPAPQETWRAIEEALRACLPDIDANPLGRVAAIVDVVPWKFRNWSKVDENVRRALILAGQPYLRWTLSTYPPAMVVVAGQDAWTALAAAFPERMPGYSPNGIRSGELYLNGVQIPVVGTVAPTARRDRFRSDMRAIAARIRQALALEDLSLEGETSRSPSFAELLGSESMEFWAPVEALLDRPITRTGARAKRPQGYRLGTFATNVKLGVVANGDGAMRVHLWSRHTERQRVLEGVRREVAGGAWPLPDGVGSLETRRAPKGEQLYLELAWERRGSYQLELERVNACIQWFVRVAKPRL
jgi:hypothetical protein